MQRKVSFLRHQMDLLHSWNSLIRRRFNLRRSNVIGLFVVIISSLGVFISVVAQNRVVTFPYRFLIPEGYVGWVRVDFDVATAPPLPVEEGYRVFKFTESGRLQTSSSDGVESRRNQFFYYSDRGTHLLKAGGPLNKRLVQGEFSGPGSGHLSPVPNRYRYIFIGPRDAFEKHRARDPQLTPKESDGYPRVGAQMWLTQEELDKFLSSQP